jgi:hypothetical protein
MSFIVDKFYNKTAGFNQVWPALNFTLQPNADLHQQQRTYSKWVTLQDAFGYKIIVYDKETLRAPLPVTFVKPKAVDKGGSPLEKALIEVWILDINASNPVDISALSGGPVTITRSFLNLRCELTNTTFTLRWRWETKRVADPDAPQRFKEVKWDRLNITIGTTSISAGAAVAGQALHQERDGDRSRPRGDVQVHLLHGGEQALPDRQQHRCGH